MQKSFLWITYINLNKDMRYNIHVYECLLSRIDDK